MPSCLCQDFAGQEPWMLRICKDLSSSAWHTGLRNVCETCRDIANIENVVRTSRFFLRFPGMKGPGGGPRVRTGLQGAGNL